MMDLTSVTTNLEQHSDGIWYARQHSPIDYPEEGNTFCYGVEEGSFWFNHRNAFILEALHRYPPAGLLFDVGGGNGYVAKAIQLSGIETVLIEPGIEGIKNAHLRGLNQLVCATLQDAKFTPHSMPAVGIFDVLEHIENDEGFLATLDGLMVSGGRLYITVPAYKWLWSIEDEFAQHYRRYTLSELKNKLNQAGFRIEFSTYIFASLPLPIFLFRTIPSRFGLRKQGDLRRVESELRPVSNTTNRMLNKILRFELWLLRTFNTLPFGGSCLVVACSN